MSRRIAYRLLTPAPLGIEIVNAAPALLQIIDAGPPETTVVFPLTVVSIQLPPPPPELVILTWPETLVSSVMFVPATIETAPVKPLSDATPVLVSVTSI